MKLLTVILTLFFAVGCQTFVEADYADTRVILAFNKPLNKNEITATLNQLRKKTQVRKISLVRQSNSQQLVVIVNSSKNPAYWLAELNDATLIHYAEIDSKKKVQ
jgi:uncharacterized protein YcfL